MRIRLDADGVLLDFCRSVFEAVGSMRTIADVTQWDMFELIKGWYGETTHRLLIEQLAHGDFWRGIRPVEGAVDAVRALLLEGHDIKVVTSPWTSGKEWGDARYEVLERHFGLPSKRVIVAADKSDVGGDMLVDDRPEHLHDWCQAHPGKPGVLVDAPYNRQAVLPEHCYRIASICVLPELLKQL